MTRADTLASFTGSYYRVASSTTYTTDDTTSFHLDNFSTGCHDYQSTNGGIRLVLITATSSYEYTNFLNEYVGGTPPAGDLSFVWGTAGLPLPLYVTRVQWRGYCSGTYYYNDLEYDGGAILFTVSSSTPAGTVSTSTTGTIAFPMDKQELLFVFGLFVFLASVPFWERTLTVSRGAYDIPV
jgi:hypothetical protein